MGLAETLSAEDLRERRLVSNTDGRPVPWMTDEKWQKEFALRKESLEPYPADKKRMGAWCRGKSACDGWGGLRACSDEEWDGYKNYINGVLSVIKKGKEDYAYFIYQVMDLARFHPEDLETEYMDGYWKVWLKSKERRTENGKA